MFVWLIAIKNPLCTGVFGYFWCGFAALAPRCQRAKTTNGCNVIIIGEVVALWVGRTSFFFFFLLVGIRDDAH